jgi:hypothetical protein
MMIKPQKKLYLGLGILIKLALMLTVSFFLFGCMLQTVPEYGVEIPKGIESTAGVVSSVRQALEKEGWQIRRAQPGLIEAFKMSGGKSADVYIVYGYQGYSIEYVDSDNMQYDAQKDTIDNDYRKWTGDLNRAIIHFLKERAHD